MSKINKFLVILLLTLSSSNFSFAQGGYGCVDGICGQNIPGGANPVGRPQQPVQRPPAQPAPQPVPQPNPQGEPGNKPPVFPPYPRLPAPCNRNFFSNFNRQRPKPTPTPRLLDATLFRFFR